MVALSLLLFAFSSILGWSYYGQQCLRYLSGGDRLLPAYRTVFLACTLAGALWEPGAIWLLVDLSNALMALPNLAALLLLAPEALTSLGQWTAPRPTDSVSYTHLVLLGDGPHRPAGVARRQHMGWDLSLIHI